MKTASRLTLTFLCLILFSFQSIFAQPLFISAKTDLLSHESQKAILETKLHFASELSALRPDYKFVMPTPEQLELLSRAEIEEEIMLEDWMKEPGARSWDLNSEENVELEKWMYKPAEWLQ